MSKLWNSPLRIFLTLCLIVLVHFGVEVASGRNIVNKSPRQSSWDKVASGVKVTSWLFFPIDY